MYPFKQIVQFLLSGVTRLPASERIETLCAIFAGMLPKMSEDDIAEVRSEVISRLWPLGDAVEPVLDLIDGHLALRELFSVVADESADSGDCRP